MEDCSRERKTEFTSLFSLTAQLDASIIVTPKAMSSLASPIVSLTEANRRPGCGNKAAVLARLISAGFDVPPGFVVTSDVFLWHLRLAGLEKIDLRTADRVERGEAHTAILNTEIAPEIWELIVDAYEELVYTSSIGEPRLVVRPSANPHLIGAYESFTSINSPEQLQKAIRRIWASAWTEHADCLLRRDVPTGQIELGVLVQIMVDSEIHGLTVTANPLTGNPHQILTCTDGACGSKAVVFDLCSLNVEGNFAGDSPFEALISAEKAILAEQVVGRPAEIEWAYDGSRLWILQAQRSEGIPAYFPITVAPDAREFARVTRSPVSVLVRSVLWPRESARAIKLPLRAAREEQSLINGFVYRCSSSVLRDACVMKDPRIQDGEIVRAQRELNRITVELPSLSANLSALLREDLNRMPMRELIRVFHEAARLYRRSVELLDYCRYPSQRFPKLLREFLGSGSDAESTYQQLMAGAALPFIARDTTLQDLGDRLAAARSTGKIEDDQWRKQFRQEVENFAREYCYAFQHHGEPYDVASWKSWIEDSDILFRIIGALARRGKRASLPSLWEVRKRAVPQVKRDILAAYSGRAREHLSKLIVQSLGWVEARSAAYCVCARAGTALRLAMLELGSRLQGFRALVRPEDIFHFELDECDELACRGMSMKTGEIVRLLADRKHRIWLQERLQAPEKLPIESEAEPKHASQDQIRGQPCSPGVAQGRVLIADNISDACSAEPGHIIVSRELTSAWTPLLGVACGFVSENPGETVIASMAALHGSPIVSDCVGATEVFSTGELVALDGLTGRIERILG